MGVVPGLAVGSGCVAVGAAALSMVRRRVPDLHMQLDRVVRRPERTTPAWRCGVHLDMPSWRQHLSGWRAIVIVCMRTCVSVSVSMSACWCAFALSVLLYP